MLLCASLLSMIGVTVVVAKDKDDDRYILRIGVRKVAAVERLLENNAREARAKDQCGYDDLMRKVRVWRMVIMTILMIMMIMMKVPVWRSNVERDSLFFDDPVANFMFVKAVTHDLPAMFSKRTMERVPPATAQNMNKTVGQINRADGWMDGRKVRQIDRKSDRNTESQMDR